MKDEEIISLMRDKKEHRALVKLYKYQSKVVSLIKSRGGSKEDAQDVFQDALLILCKNVWKGDFVLTAKLDTYLYGVCYNLWRTISKAKGKTITDENLDFPMDDEMEELLAHELKLKKVEQILQKLGDPCLQLLTLFYYKAKKIKEIVKQMGYKSENSVKVQKYKCMERAKKMISL